MSVRSTYPNPVIRDAVVSRRCPSHREDASVWVTFAAGRLRTWTSVYIIAFHHGDDLCQSFIRTSTKGFEEMCSSTPLSPGDPIGQKEGH